MEEINEFKKGNEINYQRYRKNVERTNKQFHTDREVFNNSEEVKIRILCN